MLQNRALESVLNRIPGNFALIHKRQLHSHWYTTAVSTIPNTSNYKESYLNHLNSNALSRIHCSDLGNFCCFSMFHFLRSN